MYAASHFHIPALSPLLPAFLHSGLPPFPPFSWSFCFSALNAPPHPGRPYCKKTPYLDYASPESTLLSTKPGRSPMFALESGGSLSNWINWSINNKLLSVTHGLSPVLQLSAAEECGGEIGWGRRLSCAVRWLVPGSKLCSGRQEAGCDSEGQTSMVLSYQSPRWPPQQLLGGPLSSGIFTGTLVAPELL